MRVNSYSGRTKSSSELSKDGASEWLAFLQMKPQNAIFSRFADIEEILIFGEANATRASETIEGEWCDEAWLDFDNVDASFAGLQPCLAPRPAIRKVQFLTALIQR